jgi:hypothetical protein
VRIPFTLNDLDVYESVSASRRLGSVSPNLRSITVCVADKVSADFARLARYGVNSSMGRSTVRKADFGEVESQPLGISKTLARFSSVTTDRGAANFCKRFRGLHTYRLSVISEKKKAKEPISKLSFRLPGSHSCAAESCVSTAVIGCWRRAKGCFG